MLNFLRSGVLDVERESLARAFGIQVLVPNELGVKPRVREFSARKRERTEPAWIVCGVHAVNGDRFARVILIQCLVCGNRIVEVARRQRKAAFELIVQLGLGVETQADSLAEPVLRTIHRSAERRLRSQPEISAENKRAEIFQPLFQAPLGDAHVAFRAARLSAQGRSDPRPASGAGAPDEIASETTGSALAALSFATRRAVSSCWSRNAARKDAISSPCSWSMSMTRSSEGGCFCVY